jgi:glycosyltransferase involved in cell wall biosynthesis
MSNGPKISVVTPSYNQANYLETCLRSVAYQSYSNIEHIVVDGGSSDGSQKILEEYQKRDARLQFSSGPDNGQGDAVNKGFSCASGDIIAWINSDDYYFDTEVFKFVVEFFNKNPDIDIIYGGMAYMDRDDVLTHIRIPPAYNYAKLTRISYIGNTNTFLRRRVINKHILDPDCHYVIDHEYMLRITKDFKAYRTKRMIACFRVHPEAKTQTMSLAIKDAERLRRDQKHGIKTGLKFQFLVLWDRIFYRLSLLYTDYKFIGKWKNDAPFNKFTK